MKVFRDAVHDLISLGPDDLFILDLIDTKEFQRLRRIRQLGLANLVYPCAEHTRFVHSLGVFNFARRIISQLASRHRDDQPIKSALDEHAKTIKAAALLHDLGHGPCSHVFERVFKGGQQVKHEEWTCKILRDPRTEVNQRLVAAKINVNALCALIWDQAPQECTDVEPVAEPFIKDIVSSQLDADRMDYLLRDSLLSGARYGQYDCEWIVNALVIGTDPFGERKMKLCLDASKGTGAINAFLIARLLMTQHVYGHKTTRAYESELLYTLRLAETLAADLPDGTPPPMRDFLAKRGDVPVDTYLLLDDEVTWGALRQWATWSKKLPQKKPSKKRAEALQRHARRLVRRMEPWATCLLTEAELVKVNTLLSKLGAEQQHLTFECFLDDGKFLPYKDLRVSLARSGDDEQA
ncbi:MAG: HD domain-containing protein, partial [bacterium]|nr:HD domain-containing protein [bacterium]